MNITLSEIERIADELLIDVSTPPTDLQSVGRKLNVDKFLIEPLPHLGELRFTDAGLVVVTTQYLSFARRRFTIAHELSHAALNKFLDAPLLGGPSLERSCDRLAAELLMPRWCFADSPAASLTVQSLIATSQKFYASLQATAIRSAELFGASVFETRFDTIVWGFGRYSKGSICRYPLLEQLFISGELTEPGSLALPPNSRGESLRLDWAPIERTNKVLFIEAWESMQSLRPVGS